MNISSLQNSQNPNDEIIESNNSTTIQEHNVIKHLDLAIQSAEEEGMATSELIGLLFYYAHNLAHEARNVAINNDRSLKKELSNN